MSAIDAALGDGSETLTNTETETPVEESSNGTAEEAEGGDEEQTTGEHPDTETAEDETDETADEKPRGADGKFLKQGETAEEQTEEKPAQRREAARKPDPVKDPIPKDTAQPTADRIRALVRMNNELSSALATVTADFDTMIGGIKATGAGPQQYGEVLNWMKLFYSNNLAEQKQAYELVESVAERLAMKLGVERKGTDPLAAHQDLQAAVAAKQLTPEYAKQIATDRNSKKFNTELQTQADSYQQQQAQIAQDTARAKADLTTLGTTLQATDPDYARKRALIVPVLKPLFHQLPPAQWKQAFETAYRNVVIPRGVARPGKVVPQNQSTRPRGSAPNGNVQPDKGVMDVMNQAISEV
jgi:hypothetical protein